MSRPHANSAQRLRLHQPPLADATRDQGRDRERERHREPDVAQVQDRWVEQHEDVVLEQRVRARPVENTGRAVLERRRGSEADQREERGDDEHHDERPADKRIVGAPPEAPGDCRRVSRDHDRPQQDRPFERAPHRGHVVERWRGGRPDLLHVREREVPGDQRPLHHHDREHRAGQPEPRVPRRESQCARVAGADRERRRQCAERHRGQHQHQPGVAEREVEARRDHPPSAGQVAGASASARAMRSELASS